MPRGIASACPSRYPEAEDFDFRTLGKVKGKNVPAEPESDPDGSGSEPDVSNGAQQDW